MEIHKPQTNEFLNFSTLRSYTHKPSTPTSLLSQFAFKSISFKFSILLR